MTRERFTLNFPSEPTTAVDCSRTAPALQAAGSGQHAVSLVLENPYTVSIRDFSGRTLAFLDPEGVYLFGSMIRKINYAEKIPVTMLSVRVDPHGVAAQLHMRRDVDELVFGKDFPDAPENWQPTPGEYTYIDQFLFTPPVISPPATPAAPAAGSMQPNRVPAPSSPTPQYPAHFDLQRRSAALNEYQTARKEGTHLWVLWLLTGWIGGHRYYLGDNRFGIILTVLFFLGGLSIPVALVDGLFIHNRMKDKNTARWHYIAEGYDTPIRPQPEGTTEI